MIEKCKCQHCDTRIEFEAEHAGEMVDCPNCKMPTTLFVPVKSVPPPPPRTSTLKARRISKIIGRTVAGTFAMFAILFVLSRILPEANPEDNHPAGFSGIYVGPFGLSCDLRSDGGAVVWGHSGMWFIDGNRIHVRSNDGLIRQTFSEEGNDLVDSLGHRWQRE